MSEIDAELVGSTLAGRYDILELLGTGGMGTVYRARDRELDELVALKVIKPELAAETEIVERFRSEVKLARRVTHANVARTFELGHADGVMYCTMELVDGESLTARLHRVRKLAVGEAVAIACALCDGLAAAHAADVIHRDIKPDNVLLASDGRVVMADFGVAAVSVTGRRELSGTPAYMAPEQARGEPPTPAVDVYAVGVLLYEMITGRRAFAGEVTKILADKQVVERLMIAPPGDVPAELADVIANATARDREHRLATAGSLRRALEPWAHPGRAATHPPRLVIEKPEVTNVVVVGPAGDGPSHYLGEAVYDELIARLGKVPRVRVLPRAQAAPEPGDFVLSLEVTDVLVARVALEGRTISELHLPLAIERVDDVAEALTRATAGSIATVSARRSPEATHEALDLLYRARHLALRQFHRIMEARDLLEQAYAIAPRHPQIAGTFAVAQVRLAFFSNEADPASIERARQIAQQAVAIAPHEAYGHLALGHVELNMGDPVAAAAHFRVAIACAPNSAESHEQLGRMLLEAGYVEQGLARLEDAIAMNPKLQTAMWEIARARALEGRWDEVDAIVAHMQMLGTDRVIARARYAWWRRDRAQLERLRDQLLRSQNIFVPGLVREFVAIFIDNDWANHRESIVAIARSMPPIPRRRSFTGQLVVEAAAHAGDVPIALEMLELAIGEGLFDLYWLDRCPLLEPVRADPAFAPLRGRIKRRADAILDALYGDHELGTSETAIASSLG